MEIGIFILTVRNCYIRLVKMHSVLYKACFPLCMKLVDLLVLYSRIIRVGGKHSANTTQSHSLVHLSPFSRMIMHRMFDLLFTLRSHTHTDEKFTDHGGSCDTACDVWKLKRLMTVP
jgi:hypothetical protein